jgi:hypothetical protein
MTPLDRQRHQYGLASLFWLTLVAAILLWAWTIGWWKVAAVVALGTAVLFVVAWFLLLIDLRRG